MSETVNTATIRVVADASGVEAGLRQATDAARQAGRAVSEVGNGAAASTRNVETAQRNIIAAIQRTTTAMEAGGRSTAAYYDLLARQRGVAPSALSPYIAALKAVEEAQTRAAQTLAAQQAAQQQAAESARAQAVAQRELAQAQAGRESFLNGLREQIALYGKSTEEVMRYRAAQADASQAAQPLIAQLQAMRTAQEQAEGAARAQAAAQREAAQADANRGAFLDGLREQIALYGKSTEEVLQYRAAQLGAANAAAPLIAQLHALRDAQEQAAAAARAAEKAQRDAQQAQVTRDNFLAGLREQIALFGKSTDEVLRYQAAQIGAAAAADPLIAQLHALTTAQEQAAVAARAAEKAQQEAAQAQAKRDNFLDNLREQIALYGRSTEETLRYQAAQLGLASAAEPLIQQLHSVRTAQEQVTAASRAAEQAQREAAQVQANKDSFIAGLREQIALFGLSTEEAQRYRAAQLGLASSADPLIAQLHALRTAEEQVAAAAKAAAQAQREADQVQAGRDSFVKSLEAEANAIGKTRLELLELKAAQLGVTQQAQPFLAQLRASEESMRNGGMSAAAMNAALRQVPAQLTDIIVGLQGGQAPLTVLLQQGGQLRDMFGSVGGAAKALGGAVLGLINPYTVGAAAIAGMAYAFKVGHDESIEYGRALALTGNIAGVTTSQMSDMAHELGNVVGSQHAAAGALAELASTGTIAGANLQKFAGIAVEVQRVVGRSVQDTAAEFAELGKSPLSALDKISEKYHFITAATYAQVKAAQDHGHAIEAASIAQNAYADGIAKQRQKVLESLSDWERGWIRIKTAAGDALDAVIDFASGREKGNAEKINDLMRDRNKILVDLDRAKARGLAADVAAYEAALDSNKREIDAIRDKDSAKKKVAETEAAQARADELRNKWLGESNILLTRQQLLQRDLDAARTEGAANGLSEVEIQDRLTVVRRKYNDVYVQGIDTSITALRRRAEVQAELDKRALAQIESQRSVGGISDEDAINQAAKIELDALGRQTGALQQQLGLVRTKINSQKEQADLEGQIAVAREQRVTREKQQQLDLLAIQEKRRQASLALYGQGILSATAERDGLVASLEAQFQYNQEIGLNKIQVAELRAARMDNAAALKDEAAAALEAIEPNSELAKSYREQAQAMRDLGEQQVWAANREQKIDLWKQSVDQYGQVFQQGFADMLNNGQAGWSSFTKSLVTTFKTSVADQIYKMFARPIIVQLVGSYLGISQQAIAGEIASQPNGYGITKDSTSPIGAAQSASTLYSAITGGFAKLSTSVASGVDSLLGQFGPSTIGSTGPSAAASLAGTAASYGAGVLAGHSIGNAIAGDYSVSHGQAVTNIASVVGAVVGGPIGGAIGGAIGGLINRAFGMGSKEVTAQGIKGTLTADSLTGSNYSTWHQDGGWFRSDKNGTDTTALTDAMVKQFTQGLSSIELASTGFASSLGVSADSIKDYSKVFDLKLTGDATKDQQAITDFFTGIGDEIANKLVPNLADFSKSGEAAAATLERLAGDFKGTDQVAQLLGFSADKLFGATGLESAKAREQLIDLAGGLSTLSSEASFFNQNFLTDAERIAPVATALDKAMASLGLETIPTTRDEFKGLVNSLILSGAAATEAGAKQLDSLLALGEAFAQVHPDTAAADAQKAEQILQERADLQKQLDELTMSSTELLAQQRAALDESNRALFDQIQALKSQASALEAIKAGATAALGGVDSAFSVLQTVVTREKTAIQSSIDVHTASVTKLQSLSQALHSTLDSLKSPDQKLVDRALGQAQIRAALAIAKAGGPLPDADSLKDALSAVTQDASTQFSSYTDYLRDLYQTQSDIASLAGSTDDSLSVEQQALKVAQDQLVAVDAMLQSAQDQIDILKGVDANGLTLVQAMQALTQAMVNAKGNPIVGATSAINGAYQQYLGRTPDAAGLEWWQNAAANGTSVSDIVGGIANSTESTLNTLYQQLLGRAPDAEGLAFWGNAYGSTMDEAEKTDFMSAVQGGDESKKRQGIPGFAAGGMFGGGLRIVGEDGPELEATGPARIWSSNQTAALLARGSGGGDSDALAAEVKALREEVVRLRRAAERAADNTGRSADMFESATAGGNGPMLVEIA